MHPERDAAGVGATGQRRDAAENRRRLVDAALAAVVREGRGVPLATIADEAGVGIATLYRHFPDRESLLDELTCQSFGRVLDNVRRADTAGRTGLEAISTFIDAAVRDRHRLVLPLHGGGAIRSDRTRDLQAQVATAVAAMVRRGQDDGTVRAGTTGTDVVLFGALLAQPRSPVPNWNVVSKRLKQTYLRGLAP